MDYTAISIKDTRDNLADIIERVAIAGETFLVTKFGKAKAIIAPFTDSAKMVKAKEKILDKYFGAFKGRKDMANSGKWVERLRNKEQNRYGRIFD